MKLIFKAIRYIMILANYENPYNQHIEIATALHDCER
jgi:hypothetical protein